MGAKQQCKDLIDLLTDDTAVNEALRDIEDILEFYESQPEPPAPIETRRVRGRVVSTSMRPDLILDEDVR